MLSIRLKNVGAMAAVVGCMLSAGGLSVRALSVPAARLAEQGGRLEGGHMMFGLLGLAKDSSRGPVSGSLESGACTYCGSQINASGFSEVREGSIISVINDPAALICNAGTDGDNDAIHVPDASALPPQGTPVKFTLRGPPEKQS